MNGIINITSPDRVVVNVLNLLPHHRLCFDHFRVAALLPKLMLLVRFVFQLVILQLLQQSLRSLCSIGFSIEVAVNDLDSPTRRDSFGPTAIQ